VRNALFIAVADLRLSLRQRETLLWVFLMPAVFFYFIGSITGGSKIRGEGERRDPLVLEVGPDAGFLEPELERRLEAAGYELAHGTAPATVEDAEAAGDAGRGPWLRVPAGFTDAVLAGERPTVTLLRREASLMGDYDRFRAGRAVYETVADLVATAADGRAPSPAAFAELRELPRSLAVVARPAGKRRTIPSGFEQTVPGTMVMFTLIVLLTRDVVATIVERREGLLRRLASSPMRRGEIVLGKWAGSLALGIVQLAVAMAIGTFAFGMDWGPDLPMVALVLVAWASFVASLGLVLGSLLDVEGQAVAVGVLSANVLAALGGCWWPIEVAPGWMQHLQPWLPTGWAMAALHDLVSFQSGPASAIGPVVTMFAGALVLGAVGARRFRFH